MSDIDRLALTKLDVLRGIDPISVCVSYELGGKELGEPPYDDLDRVRPVYEHFHGWKEDIAQCRSLDDLPENARRYVKAIEALAGCKLMLVSVGADRSQTIQLENPFRMRS